MPKSIRQRFGRQVRTLRQRRGLTQDELAARSGISTKYLQNLEGKTPKAASIDTLGKLADGLGVPVWTLLKIGEESGSVAGPVLRGGSKAREKRAFAER